MHWKNKKIEKDAKSEFFFLKTQNNLFGPFLYLVSKKKKTKEI